MPLSFATVKSNLKASPPNSSYSSSSASSAGTSYANENCATSSANNWGRETPTNFEKSASTVIALNSAIATTAKRNGNATGYGIRDDKRTLCLPRRGTATASLTTQRCVFGAANYNAANASDLRTKCDENFDNFYSISSSRRLRTSASVEPCKLTVDAPFRHAAIFSPSGASTRTSRYVSSFASKMSASNSAGIALSSIASVKTRRGGYSLSRDTVNQNANALYGGTNENNDEYGAYESQSQTSRLRRLRRESRLHVDDAGGDNGCDGSGDNGKSESVASAAVGATLTVPTSNNRRYCSALKRSSSASIYSNSSSSASPSSSNSSNPPSPYHDSSSASSTTVALTRNTKSNTIANYNNNCENYNDKNHPNEKIIKRSHCVELVASRAAFYRLYEFGGLIGHGNFSNVHVVYADSSGQKFAVKEIDKARMNGKTYFVENEVAILKRCTHRNICRLFEAFQCQNFYFLVFEYASKGDLFETIKRMNYLSERTSAQITCQVASALGYLHARRVAHRDVKPENILLGANLSVKLTDFGLACTVLGPLYRVCGTPTYVAPEVLTQEGYGVEVDVWSLGILLYVMLIGFAPFRSADRAQLFKLIVKAKVSFEMPTWSQISPKAKQLILQLLTPKSALRLKATEVLANEWVRVHNDARNERDELR